MVAETARHTTSTLIGTASGTNAIITVLLTATTYQVYTYKHVVGNVQCSSFVDVVLLHVHVLPRNTQPWQGEGKGSCTVAARNLDRVAHLPSTHLVCLVSAYCPGSFTSTYIVYYSAFRQRQSSKLATVFDVCPMPFKTSAWQLLCVALGAA